MLDVRKARGEWLSSWEHCFIIVVEARAYVGMEAYCIHLICVSLAFRCRQRPVKHFWFKPLMMAPAVLYHVTFWAPPKSLSVFRGLGQADCSAPILCSDGSRIVLPTKLTCVVSFRRALVRAEWWCLSPYSCHDSTKVSGAISRLSLNSGWATQIRPQIASQMMYKERDGRDDRETWPAKPNAVPLWCPKRLEWCASWVTTHRYSFGPTQSIACHSAPVRAEWLVQILKLQA